MTAALEADVVVGRLRICCSEANAQASRAVISAAVRRADVRPPNLAPGAILIVRRLADPMPGGMVAASDRGDLDGRWAAAARDVMCDRVRRAARPIRGAVPDSADTVIFNDRAELLACLLGDLLQGTAGRQWWWRTLLAGFASSAGVADLLEAEAVSVPATMQLLMGGGLATPLVAMLNRAETDRVLTAVAGAHGAAELAAERPWQLGADVASADEDRGPDAGLAATGLGPAPWDAWLPAGTIPPWLPSHQQSLLGVTLLLHVRGAAVRSATFRMQLERWTDVMATGGRYAPVDEAGAGARRLLPTTTSIERGDRTVAGSEATPGPAVRAENAKHQVEVEAGRAASQESSVTRGLGAAEPPIPGSRQAATSAGDVESIPDDGIVGGVESELAGAMWLVNLLQRLGLPGCFEDGWRLSTTLGPWGTIDAIARSLIPARLDLAGDPIWTILSELGGYPRATTPPAGVAFDLRYSLPAAWWEPFARDGLALHWAARGGEMVTWAADRFVLTGELPPSAPAATAEHSAERATAQYSQATPRRRALADAPVADLRATKSGPVGNGLGRLFGFVIPYIRHRLSLDMGVPPAMGPTELLLRRGRIYSTRTHVDVVFPLDAASVAVRRSGLDRDPGWVPELGRVISYHFE